MLNSMVLWLCERRAPSWAQQPGQEEEGRRSRSGRSGRSEQSSWQ